MSTWHIMIIDTHCHLSKNDYENLDEIISNMNGIIIISGCNDETNKQVIEIVNKYENVYGTLGVHPEEIDKLTDNSFKYIQQNLNNSKIVAIGEIGLDYYWNKENKQNQQALFRKQLEIAQTYNLPVVVHSRNAIEDTYNILKEYKLKGDIHCFGSSLEMANKFIKLGYKIGIGGVVTFKNSFKLKEIVKEISLDNILLETDSPYLTPEPFRGKKNEPKNVVYVAKKIAELKNISFDEVVDITTSNAKTLFDLEFDI